MRQKEADLLRRSILEWFYRKGRDLPWRKTPDPYAILVSEFMLQQTQVTTVLPYYEKWLRRFPDFKTLADASENDVLHAWAGLGYYARARNLHQTAKIISAKYRGQCPDDIDRLESLPGIARYTASAIASFAFDRAVPVVETNVGRLLARIFNISEPLDSATGRTTVWSVAAQLVTKRSAKALNSAMMDLGATICIPHIPKCVICPAKAFCRAKNPAILPTKSRRPTAKPLFESHAFAVRCGKILLQKSNTRWRGMWILPPVDKPMASDRAIYTSTFQFTHHRVKLTVFRRPAVVQNTDQRWFDKREIDSIPLPSPHRRAVAGLLAKYSCSPD